MYRLFPVTKKTAGRPAGSVTRKEGSTSSVWLNHDTREWCKENRFTISHALNHAPQWYERMLALTQEASELREGAKKKDALLQKLWAENADLLRFKDKVREQMARVTQ